MVREKHKKSCEYSPQLLFVEPKNLFIFWGKICDNPLATGVWGQILSKDDNSKLWWWQLSSFKRNSSIGPSNS